MRMTIQLLEPVTGRRLPLRVQAPQGTPGPALLDAFPWAAGAHRNWQVEGTPLEQCRCGVLPLVEGALLVDGADSGRNGTGAPELVCTEGPDSGRRIPLRRGVLSVGKDQSDIMLEDEALGPLAGTLVVDAQNILWRPLDGEPTVLAEGHPLLLGRNQLLLRAGRRTEPDHAQTGTVSPEAPEHPLEPWRLGQVSTTRGWAGLLVSVLVPALGGVLMAVLLHVWFMLVLSGLGALGALVHWMARGSGPAQSRRRSAQLAEAEATLTARRVPAVGECLTSTARPPHLPVPVIRWGRGIRPAHLRAEGHPPTPVPVCHAAPIVTSLEAVHLLDPNLPAGVRNSMVVQILLAGFRLRFITPETSDPQGMLARWQHHPWIRCSPRPGEPDPQEVQWFLSPAPPSCLAQIPESCAVVVEGAGSEELDADVVPGRESVLVRAADSASLQLLRRTPAENCRTARHQPGFLHRPLVECTVPDQVRTPALTSWREREEGTGTRGSEGSCGPRLSDRNSLALESTRSRWAQQQFRPELWADLGQDLSTGDRLRVDLNAQGPHCVVAGTTGSGKSELLQSMLLGLALEYPPTRLNIVLIDFKGAASFGEAAALPHVRSLLTDLDEHSIYRDLAFLKHEIRRREGILAEARQPSWASLVGADSTAMVRLHMPELLVCVDEFRLLVESYPEAMKQLVRIASVGRSLGLHLILSTQRPQGAVSAEIRANVALNICLRVSSEAESVNVLGTPDASSIPADRPGEGCLAWDGRILRFQGLYADAPPRSEDPQTIQVRPFPDASDAPPQASGSVRSSLRTLVQALQDMAQDQPVHPAVIPPALSHGGLPVASAREECGPRPHRTEETALLLGGCEVPDRGWQGRLSWVPGRDGAVEVLGTDQEHLRWLRRMAEQCQAHAVPLYVLGSSPQFLASARALPGAVVHAVASSSSPDFFCDVARELARHAQQALSGERAAIILQGPERVVEELLKHGQAAESLLEDLLAASAQTQWVSVLSRRRLLPSLRHHLGSTLWAGTTGRAEFDLLHPRAARTVVQDAWIVQGRLLEQENDVGALVLPAPGPEPVDRPSHLRGHRRSRWPVLQDLPTDWSLPRRGRAPSSADGDHAAAVSSHRPRPGVPGGKLLVTAGISAPTGREVVLDLLGGGALCISGPVGSGKSSLWRFLRHGCPEAVWTVLTPEQGCVPIPVSGLRPGPTVLVMEDLHRWAAEAARQAAALAHSFDAVLVTVDSTKGFLVKEPWTAMLRRHPETIVLGPRTGAEHPLWRRAVPATRGEVPPGQGVVAGSGGLRRFCFPQMPEETEGPTPREE